jgi:phosphoribosylformylglycinamidine synthase I
MSDRLSIAVIQFPGSNCQRETCLAIERVGMKPVPFLWNEARAKLKKCHGFVIVGGFSYEDRSRAGVIASLDPVMKVIADQAALGKPVLGICNGAQVLVESGLIPGLPDRALAMALTENKRMRNDRVLGTGFYNAWVHLKKNAQDKGNNAFTLSMFDDTILRIPSAHAEGRFVMSDVLLQKVQSLGLDCLLYCNAEGEVDEQFPVNPNGSVANIAAVCNVGGNVMAMMPHPERISEGDVIFSSMRDYIVEREVMREGVLDYVPKTPPIEPYVLGEHQEWLLSSVLTDNHALSVQRALNKMRLDVNVKRYIHWEMACEDKVLPAIEQSDELYNARKEFLVAPETLKGEGKAFFLVREKEDFIAQQKRQILANHFEVDGISSLKRGVVWSIEAKPATLNKALQKIQVSHILYNPYAHDCFSYGNE